MDKVFVIMNRKAGSVSSERLAEEIRGAFESHGIEAKIRPVEGPDIEEALREGLDSDAETIVSAGGDGTLKTIATKMLGEEKPLGLIPLGTINHLARNLGIPLTVKGAIEVIAHGAVREVDVAEVNGQLFTNDSSIGMLVYALYATERKRANNALDKLIRFGTLVKMLTRLFFRFPLHWFVVRDAEGKELHDRTAFVVVTDNRYELSATRFADRKTLTSGKLTLYFPRTSKRSDLAKMFMKTLAGKMNETEGLDIVESPEFTIEIAKKRHVMISIDGEFKVLKTPLEYRITPSRLKLYAPPPEAGGPAWGESELAAGNGTNGESEVGTSSESTERRGDVR